MIQCPNCGSFNGDSREICVDCGASLNNPQGVERRVLCSRCSKVYTTKARYCPACGGKLDAFKGSVEMAKLIRDQRELDATELPGWEKALQRRLMI